MLQLFIGNKNYSSWSMRPWVLLKQLGIPFEEVMVRFDAFDASSTFKQTILAHNPVGKVPLLLDGSLAVWDTLAITEYVAEYAAKDPAAPQVWPEHPADRARARSICAEMHSGFSSLRNHCPMNIEAHLPDIGAIVWRDQAGVRADLARITAYEAERIVDLKQAA
jgi:glutathione S-transferase